MNMPNYSTVHDAKYCPMCRKDLPLSMFNRNKRNHGGYSSYCSMHEAERMREYRERVRAETQTKKREEILEAEQIEMFPKRKKRQACTCKNYHRCSECRRREQEQADKEGRLPAYLVSKIDPSVYEICAAIARHK